MNNINNVGNDGGLKRNSGPISWSLLPSLASPAPMHSLSENALLGLYIVLRISGKRRAIGMKVMWKWRRRKCKGVV